MQHLALLRKIAGICSSSLLCRTGKRLWKKNSEDWKFHLSKWDKFLCGGYVILNDFAAGIFPPKFEDQAEAYRNEIEYDVSLPGMDLVEVQRTGATKPFWDAAAATKYLGGFD